MLSFLIIMAVSAGVCTFLFSLWLIPVLLLMALAGKSEVVSRVAGTPIIIFGGLWQAAFWLVWAGYCAGITLHYTIPAGHWAWLYYIEGFTTCVGPLGYLLSAESQTKKTKGERAGLNIGSLIYSVVAAGAYVSALIWHEFIITWLQSLHPA